MKYLIGFVAIIGLLGLAGLSYMSSLSNNAVDIAQAQAAIEAARAAQDVSKGVQILAWGLSAISIINSLIALALIVYLVVNVIKKSKADQPKWAPGPNAQFGRTDRPQLPRREAAPSAQDLLNAMLYQQLMQSGRLPAPQIRQEPPDENEGEWEW